MDKAPNWRSRFTQALHWLDIAELPWRVTTMIAIIVGVVAFVASRVSRVDPGVWAVFGLLVMGAAVVTASVLRRWRQLRSRPPETPLAVMLWVVALGVLAIGVGLTRDLPPTVIDTAVTAAEPSRTPDFANLKAMYATKVQPIFPVGASPFAGVIEFGASKGRLGGFEAEFRATGPIKNVRFWWDAPHKLTQGIGMSEGAVAQGRSVVIEAQRVAVRFLCPTIGPEMSLYVYFEADEPVTVAQPYRYVDLEVFGKLCD